MSRRPAPSAAIPVVERINALVALHLVADDAAAKTALAKAEKALSGKAGAHRRRLMELFALSAAEIDALDCAVAATAEPSIGQTLGLLQGTPELHLPGEVCIRLLFGHGPEPVVHAGSPLVQWGLIEQIDRIGAGPGVWRADPAVVDWYFGRLTAGSIPVRRVAEVTPFAEWQVGEHAQRIKGILDEGRSVRVAITGSSGCGRASFAQLLALALKKNAFSVASSVIAEDPGHRTFQRLQRLALLGDVALIWRGRTGEWPAHLPLARLQFVTLEWDETVPRRAGLVDIAIPMPALGAKTITALYRQYLPALADEMADVLGQPRPADLADAAAQKIASVEELRAFLRRRNSDRTGNIGRIETSHFGWEDLVLDERTMRALKDFAAEARLRTTVLADPERRRILGNTAQLTALFAGTPGLGKSMSAKVIARDLGLDLLVVDYASMASKYIGETAKNLTAAFQVAQDAQCALVIDEADTLFASRTKVETANDRYGNADIGHLLQLMERHEGVLILSTNKRGNIDPAFIRRLRHIVEFRKPEAGERGELWDRMLALLGMNEQDRSAHVPALAAARELTPAQIKGAALTAAYKAAAESRKIGAADIEEGVRIEFRKEGRIVTPVAQRSEARRQADG